MPLDESAAQHRIAELCANPHAHYQAQLEEALFHQQALDLIRRLKSHLTNGIGSQQLSTEAAEFIAKHTTRTKP
ncbi:hypothetical protein [Pseudomonas sp. AAC]|uniref:hypothetical protein n=1 Tax=Pseudomonas sp. AAC TaxID=1502784 RepID=UPI0004D3565D|nr:hypothetical protein [Pseudomonas sp. AAC]KES23130.1 hypothetical protein FG99_16380 [Pseudomonas sp. AAC]